MKLKKASEIFAGVDPHLKVIDGGVRRKYRATIKDWEASGGAMCPQCKAEAVRFRPQDGVCRGCADKLNEKQDRDAKKRAKFLRFRKLHNARIEKKKGATR